MADTEVQAWIERQLVEAPELASWQRARLARLLVVDQYDLDGHMATCPGAAGVEDTNGR